MSKVDKKYRQKLKGQFIIWIFESIGIPLFVIYIFNGMDNWGLNIEFLNTLLLTMAIYQIILFVINNNEIASEKDMINSQIVIIKRLIVLIETSDENTEKENLINKVLKDIDLIVTKGEKNNMLINQDYLNLLESISSVVKKNSKGSIDFLKMQLVELENFKEILNLEWRNSIIIKFLK